MGKKRIIQKTDKELLDEKDKIEGALKKDVKAGKKTFKEGKLYIFSTYNNTMITLAGNKGNVLAWVSAGSIGFKGTKKATPYAASEVANTLCEKAEKMGMKEVDIFVKGVGSGRSSALRALAARNVIINRIKDITSIPHNGCRPKKPRRT